MNIANLVRERISTTGQVVSNLQLAGSVDDGYKTFADAFPNGAGDIPVTVVQPSGSMIGVASYDSVTNEISLRVTESVIGGVDAGTTALTLDGSAQVSISLTTEGLGALLQSELPFTANLAADPDFIAGFVYDARNDGLAEYLENAFHTSWYKLIGSGMPNVMAVICYVDRIELRDLRNFDQIWWVIPQVGPGGRSFWRANAGCNLTSACMANGVLYFTINSGGATTNNGLAVVDFVDDRLDRYSTSSGGGTGLRVADVENTTKTFPVAFGASQELVSFNANNVDVFISLDAPVDQYGRLVPTTVVTTNAGVSLIDVPGVVNITGLNASHVSIHNDKLYIVESGTSTVHVGPVAVAADIAVTTWRDKVYYGGSTPPLLNSAVTAIAGSIVGSSLGLTIIDEPSNAVRYISKEFATPPMTANTVAALMMDTATGVITGGELVANGVNPTDTAGWTVQNGTLEAIGGNFRLTTNGGIASAAFAMATVAGRSYQIELEFVADGLTGNAFLYVGTTAGGAQLANKVVASTLGIHRVVFVATGTTTYLSFACSSTTLANEAADFNNVHCYRVIQDRSGNGNHAKALGVVPRTLAAAGGDLVEHGPFPAGVGYEIAFDTALDLSGDFLIAGLWRIGASGYDVGLEFAAPDYSGNDFTLETGGNQDVSFKSNSSTILTAASGLTTDTIVHFAALRVSGVLTLYKNGYAVASVANTTDFSNPNAVLRFGGKVDGSVTADVSYLSRWIFEEGGLSADEVLSLAQSELAKAQAGQKITIQGTSNQVNDVAAWKGFVGAGTDDGADVFDMKTGLWVKRYDTTNTALTDNQIKTLTANADGALVLSDSTKAQRIDKPEIKLDEKQLFLKLHPFVARMLNNSDGTLQLSAPEGLANDLGQQKAFRSTGITDNATSEKVTVTDNGLVVSGTIAQASGPIASRPSATLAGPGGEYISTDEGSPRPIYKSDGVVWRQITLT